MLGSDHLHYVPLLKCKQGELDALSHLDQEDRDDLIPLIEIGPIETDPKTEVEVRSLDETLDGVAAKIAKAWGSLDFCFVDLPEFEPTARLEDGSHPASRFFEDAKAADLAVIPVTGLDRDLPYLEATAETLSWGKNQVSIRLRRAELQNPSSLAAELRRATEILQVDLPQVDLLLDFGPILKSEAGTIKNEAEAAIPMLPAIDEWHSLTLCSGAFPTTVSPEVKPGESGTIERREWKLWRALATGSQLPRLPAFGDYGVASPEWLRGFDPEIMDPAAKIVYARDADWLVVRGRSLKKKGHEQYRVLASHVVNGGSFRGTEHCWGDNLIAECAAGKGGTGNLQTWVTVATNHHLCVVAEQLASLP